MVAKRKKDEFYTHSCKHFVHTHGETCDECKEVYEKKLRYRVSYLKQKLDTEKIKSIPYEKNLTPFAKKEFELRLKKQVSTFKMECKKKQELVEMLNSAIGKIPYSSFIN